jgi:hypothetical protein
MNKYAQFLVSLANQLDAEGKTEQADIIDSDFEEFLKLLENGDLEFYEVFSGGARDVRGPYSNLGSGLPLCGAAKVDIHDIARRMGATVKGQVQAGAGYFGALQLAASVRQNERKE